MNPIESDLQIGVVIPTYNRAALCVEALESVLAQSRPPREIVVVDDGSTDDTRARIAAFMAPGHATRITYHYQDNAHLSAARNAGLALLPLSLDAVLFLDDDDRLLPDALERLVRTLALHPSAPLAYGRPRLVGPDGTPTGTPWGIEDFEGANCWETLIYRNFICTAGCVLLRRDALGDAPWDTSLRSAEDWDLWLRLSESNKQFARVSIPTAPVLDYRTLPDSMSRSHDNMRAQEEIVLEKAGTRMRAAGKTTRAAQAASLLAARRQSLARARADGVPLADALLSPRHRALRAFASRSGIAGLWRRVPLRVRLRLREILGISRWG